MCVYYQTADQNYISGTWPQSMMLWANLTSSMKTPKNLPFLEPRFWMLRDGQELRFRLLRVGSGHHQFALFIGVQSDVFLFHVRYSPKIKNMDPITLDISTVSGPQKGGSNPWPHGPMAPWPLRPIGPSNEAKGTPALIFPEGSEGETGQQNEKHVNLIRSSSRAPSSQNN